MTAIDPDDPEVRRAIANTARRQRVRDAPDELVEVDLRQQFEEG